MGLLDDDVLGFAVLGGNLSKPLMIAATALLATRATGGGGLGSLFGSNTPASPTPPATQGSKQPQGSIGAASQAYARAFNEAGTATSSTRGSDPDKTRRSRRVSCIRRSARKAVDNLARMTGVEAPDLISGLSHVLPCVIDRLTPQGRMPNQADMSHW
jgi:hypothetical protein